MNTETKAAIERLRNEVELHRHDVDTKKGDLFLQDILAVCNAAEQRDDLLAKIEYERGEKGMDLRQLAERIIEEVAGKIDAIFAAVKEGK